MESFDTRRLRAERATHAHFEELARLYHDPRVLERQIGRSDILPDAVLRDRMELVHEHWERHGFGPWVFRDRSDGQFVGRGGLLCFELEQCSGVELDLTVVPERWGQGLGTEIAAASLAVAFDRLGITEVVAWVLPSNAASQKMLTRLGFERGPDYVFGGLPFLGFRLLGRDWKAP